MIEFVWPWAAYLVPLPFILYALLPQAKQRQAVLRLPFFDRWVNNTRIANKPVIRLSFVRGLLLSLCWLAFLTAASRPQWIGEPVELPTTGRDLMMAVDISGSMEQRDLKLGGQDVTRLEVVKSVVGDFVLRREGDRLGLVLFAAQAYLQVPLTFDRKTVNTLLQEAEIGIIEEKSTAIGDSLALAVKRLRKRPEDSRVLILLTDGANNAGEITPLKAAELAALASVKIYTLGIGADQMQTRSFFGSRTVNPSSDLDEATLTEIARLTGGRYFRAKSSQDLEQIYQILDELEPIEQEAETFRPISSLFHWPLALAFCASLLLAAIKLLGRQ